MEPGAKRELRIAWEVTKQFKRVSDKASNFTRVSDLGSKQEDGEEKEDRSLEGQRPQAEGELERMGARPGGETLEPGCDGTLKRRERGQG